MKHFQNILPLLCFLLLASCAKDKTADSYRRQKVQEDLTRLQVADGRYTGTIQSQIDGRQMGAIEVSIKAQTQSAPGENNGTAPDSRAVMVTNIRYVGARTSSATATNSYYDPDKKDFNAQVAIAGEQISVSGVIDGGTFTGSIEVLNYQNYGGSFVLKKDGPSPESLVPSNGSAGSEEPIFSRSFKSFTNFFKDGTRDAENTVPANLVIVQASQSPELDFLNTFVPVKPVQLSVNFSSSFRLLYSKAIWDQRNGSLTGSLALSADKVLNITCSSQGSGERLGVKCNHASSDAGVIAYTETFYDNRIVTDTVGATSPALQKNYLKGKGETVDRSGSTKKVRATFRATLPARNREQRLLELFFPVKNRNLALTLTLIDNSSVPLNFEARNTNWDMTSGTLDGLQVLGEYTLAISCVNFFFEQSAEPFLCEYTPSHSSTYRLTFQP